MKPTYKAILFFIAIAIASALMTSCKAPLGCQDTGEMSGYRYCDSVCSYDLV
jgi:hypothetical protein